MLSKRLGMSKFVTADCEYICGHLRYGHWELDLTDAEYEEFKNLSEDEQADWISDCGHLIVDDYRVDDSAEPSNIKVYDGQSNPIL